MRREPTSYPNAEIWKKFEDLMDIAFGKGKLITDKIFLILMKNKFIGIFFFQH
jgi:hypothetical protein